MNNLILDSSIIIDFLRKKDKEKTLLFLLAKGEYKLHVSIISVAELFAGKSIWQDKNAKEALESILSGMNIIFLSADIALKSGEIKARYDIDLIDSIIASTCILSSMSLATLNLKHFKKIKDLTIV